MEPIKLSESDTVLQKCGYIKCQVEITDLVLKRQKELDTKIKVLREEIYSFKGLIGKQEKAKDLAELVGEARALKVLTDHVFALKFSPVQLPYPQQA